MALDVNTVKSRLQDHLTDGLLMVVGSGLSMAEGIPGMGALSEHLKQVMPAFLAPSPDPAWSTVVQHLEGGDHLEAAMGKASLLPSTVSAIIERTAAFISSAEISVLKRVLSREKELPLTPFLTHLFKAGKCFHLITTNYDRLVEMAAEAADIGVDSCFFGYLHGRANAKRSADSHRESYITGKSAAAFRPLPRLCVHKPHGSLDWFEVNDTLVRCPINLERSPVIITPGIGKYKESFRQAFNDQRTAGNKAASTAKRLMFIGYGFNDDHLEQYLCPSLRVTKPTVILTRDPSANLLTLLQNSPGADLLVLCAVPKEDYRTRVIDGSGEELIINEQLWNLSGFNKGVL